jgi:hypothetical protein
MPGSATPSEWIEALGSPFKNNWAVFMLAVICISALCMIWRYIPIALAGILGLITASMFFAAIYKGIYQTPQPEGWYNAGRRIYPILTDLLFNPKFLVPALIVTAALSWYYSAPTLALRTGRLFQFGILLLATYILLQGTIYVVELIQKNMDTGTVWMPRYMGFAWPAFAIALCALLMRLPTRPVRYLAIALLLGVNLAQAWGRMFAGSEPPIDHIMRDLWAAESSNDTVRTYVQQGGTSAHPAGGSLSNNPGRYYLSINRGAAWHPLNYLNVEIATVITVRNQTTPYAVSADLRRNPDIGKVIVWERIPEKPADTSADPHLIVLGEQWERQSDDFFPVRFHWNWSELYTARRKVYVRKPPAPSPPAASLRTPSEDRLVLVAPQHQQP